MSTSEYELVDQLFDLVGDDLIAVAEYDSESLDVQYVTGEAVDAASESTVERIHREMVLEQLSVEYLESMFEFGDLSYITLDFEEGIVLNVIGSETDGAFILIDANASDRAFDIPDELRGTVTANQT